MTLASVGLPARTTLSPPLFAMAFVIAAMVFAACVPYQFLLITVVLCAAPHQLLELRYFLTHVPMRWGPRRGFFLLALAGWATLGSAFIAIHFYGLDSVVRLWTAALLIWVFALIHFRTWRSGASSIDGVKSKRPCRRILLLCASTVGILWIPLPWDFVLIYAHPLVALAFLDRELRTHAAWRAPYRVCLATVPLLVAALWWAPAAASMPLTDPETMDRVYGLVGAWIFPTLAPQHLVAAYVFLQMLHYGVWLMALPALRFREAPWGVERIPLARRFPCSTRALLAMSAFGVIVLWSGFAISFATAWDLYFTVAILHAVAELPLLIHKCCTR